MTHVAAYDVQTANMARLYDYWRGGKERLPPDIALAQQVEALYPPGRGPRELVRANRAFLERAVADSVHDYQAGCRQVIDLGCGFIGPRDPDPRNPALHEVALRASASARVAYVDTDPLVTSHGEDAIARAGVPGVVMVRKNLAVPGEVMASPVLNSVIDYRKPSCVVLGLVLHFTTAADARRIIEGWMEWLPSGSRFVVTAAHWDDVLLYERMRAVYGPAVICNHSEEQLHAILRGLDLLGSGRIETARGWGPECVGQASPARVLAAVARKP